MPPVLVKVSVDIPPLLRSRVAHAAVNRGLTAPIYARSLVIEWLSAGQGGPGGGARPPLAAAREARVPRSVSRPVRIPITKGQHRDLRMAAVLLDVGIGPLVAMILDARCPLDSEIAAEMLGG